MNFNRREWRYQATFLFLQHFSRMITVLPTPTPYPVSDQSVMAKRIFVLALSVLFWTPPTFPAQPKLIVVISLDQFRYDYISRFRQYFGMGGFNFLLDSGANFTNASYKHAANVTGPGHATMLSGTYGNVNGIIANDWYDRSKHEKVYCVGDETVSIVGATGEGRSSRNFTGSTLGDELRLKNGFRSKVISLSNKDRAAILMAGKNPTGAFWMMDSVFVTSTYYMKKLPDWVHGFNRSGLLKSYFGKIWEKKLSESAYVFLDDDNARYEKDANGMGITFPHRVIGNDSTKITPSYYGALWSSPFSAQVLAELAKQAILAERLGQRNILDMLCISFSAPDGVGHAYGPYSHEVMDMALQMDGILTDFFSYIDNKIGLRNCVFVLTSDHGVAPIPEYLLVRNPNADAGRIPVKTIELFCSRVLSTKFGEPMNGGKWIEAIAANNIYLDRRTLSQPGFPSIEVAAKELAETLVTLNPIAAVYTGSELSLMATTTPIENKMKRSFNKLRSGDVVYALKPYWTEGDSPYGASHGEPYDYDAHVPLIIVGEDIRKGSYATEASPADIAPTLSALLGIEFPAGREGRVLIEALK